MEDFIYLFHSFLQFILFPASLNAASTNNNNYICAPIYNHSLGISRISTKMLLSCILFSVFAASAFPVLQ